MRFQSVLPGASLITTSGRPRSPRCWGGLRRCMGLRRFFAYFLSAAVRHDVVQIDATWSCTKHAIKISNSWPERSKAHFNSVIIRSIQLLDNMKANKRGFPAQISSILNLYNYASYRSGQKVGPAEGDIMLGQQSRN